MKSIVIFIFICVVNVKGFLVVHPISNFSVQPAFDKRPNGPKACECGKSSPSRIIGGTQAPKLKYRWMTAVCLKRLIGDNMCGHHNLHCGGSLINKFYVLTAAHCTFGKIFANFKVSVGDWDLSEGMEVESSQNDVAEIIQHRKFNFNSLENDIALLRLKSRVDFTNDIMPICLPIKVIPEPTFVDETVTVIGWGTTSAEGEYPEILREVDVKVLTNAKCKEQYGENAIKSSMICAALPGKDSCSGDSGGPMTFMDPSKQKHIQIGIVSFGIGCADPNYAGVYTRVTSFLNWIDDKIGNEVVCYSRS